MPELDVVTDPELPEPKGISTANSGQIYESDGLGSGTWVDKTAYGSIFSDEGDAITVGTIGTTVKKLAAFTQDGPASNVSVDALDSSITIEVAGDYYINFTNSLKTVASGDSGDYIFSLRINDVEQSAMVERSLSGSGDSGSITFSTIETLAVNDVITVWVESDNGADTDDIDIKYISLIAMKVS